MQKLVFTNGNGLEIDLTAGNFGITNWAGLSDTSLNIQTQQVPFEDGGVFLDALIEQREIELTVAIYDGNNLGLRYQKKRELISALNPKAGEGVLVYTNDYLTRQIKAVPQLPIFENKNSNDSGTLKASVVFSCPSPYWEDVEETEVVISKSGTNVENNGDVPVQVQIKFEADTYPNYYSDQYFSSPYLYNGRTAQKIQLNGSYNAPVIVDTNIGNKRAYANSINPEVILTGSGNVIIKESSYYNKIYMLREAGLYKSTNGTEWTLIKTLDSTGYEICIYENIIILYYEDSYNNVTKVLVTLDEENWQEITLSRIIGKLIIVGNKIYGISRNDQSKYHIYYASLSITNNVVTIGTFTEANITNEEYDVIVMTYNPYLNKIVTILDVLQEGGWGDFQCWTGYTSSWTYKASINYPSTGMKMTYVPSTHSVLIFGTQYGNIFSSVDCVEWEEHYINGKMEMISYIDDQRKYVAVGRDLGAYQPRIAISEDLNTWHYILPSYSQRETSFLTNIIYIQESKKYLISGNYTALNGDLVLLFTTDLIDEINLIQNLTADSNINFNLAVGTNNLLSSGNVKCTVSYRQKYIGV